MNIHPSEPPRLELARLPTPLVELKNLAAQTGVGRILMKRDDLTGLELSGNKIRKLEYVVADALARGANTLVTHGGFQQKVAAGGSFHAADFREKEGTEQTRRFQLRRGPPPSRFGNCPGGVILRLHVCPG